MSDLNRPHDLVIIGGGLAGLTAGVRAAELGLRPLLLEKGDGVDYPCNSRMSGGILHIAFHDPYRPTRDLVEIIERVSEGQTSPELAQALAETGARLVSWLQEKGARFMRFNPQEGYRWCLSPPRALRAGIDWKDRGPDVVLRLLVQKLQELGGTLQLNAHVSGLLMENGRCVGAHGSCDGALKEWRAPFCVLADGGFQANQLLVQRYITPRFDSLFQRGARTGHGDGLLMAQAAGAALTECSRFYGHLLCSDARHNDQVWPYPEVDSVATAGIVVDGSGRRFVDEGLSGVSLANQIASQATTQKLFAVFDAAIWQGPGASARIPANPLLERAGGTILRAGSVAELAQLMDVPRGTLEETLDSYNRAFDSGQLQHLEVARSNKVQPHAVRQLPLMAIPICAGITYTMGGIQIDAHAQVLDEAGAPMPGLFAAGATTGGIEGGKGSVYIGGLIKAGSFGLLAAERIASLLGKRFSITRPHNAQVADASCAAPGQTQPASAAASTHPATTAVRGLARFPILYAAVHYGKTVASIAAAAVAVVSLLTGWALIGWYALPLTLLLAAITLVTLLGIVELVTLVTQFLMPE